MGQQRASLHRFTELGGGSRLPQFVSYSSSRRRPASRRSTRRSRLAAVGQLRTWTPPALNGRIPPIADIDRRPAGGGSTPVAVTAQRQDGGPASLEADVRTVFTGSTMPPCGHEAALISTGRNGPITGVNRSSAYVHSCGSTPRGRRPLQVAQYDGSV